MDYDQIALATLAASLISALAAVKASNTAAKIAQRSAASALEVAKAQRGDPIALHIRQRQIAACQELLTKAVIATRLIVADGATKDDLSRCQIALDGVEIVRVKHIALLPSEVLDACSKYSSAHMQAFVFLWWRVENKEPKDSVFWDAYNGHMETMGTARDELVNVVRLSVQADKAAKVASELIEAKPLLAEQVDGPSGNKPRSLEAV